jgi:hypothetical protein
LRRTDVTIHLYPFNLPPVAEMNTAQLDGQECVYCPGDGEGRMKPVGRVRSGPNRPLLFAHIECAEAHRWEDE